jgi:hypothetical protein
LGGGLGGRGGDGLRGDEGGRGGGEGGAGWGGGLGGDRGEGDGGAGDGGQGGKGGAGGGDGGEGGAGGAGGGLGGTAKLMSVATTGATHAISTPSPANREMQAEVRGFGLRRAFVRLWHTSWGMNSRPCTRFGSRTAPCHVDQRLAASREDCCSRACACQTLGHNLPHHVPANAKP